MQMGSEHHVRASELQELFTTVRPARWRLSTLSVSFYSKSVLYCVLRWVHRSLQGPL
jgi:hypothetical protein